MADEIDEVTRKRLLAREQPYGYTVLPDRDLHEATDRRNEQEVLSRWAGPLRYKGAPVIGIRDVPNQPEDIDYDGFTWTFRLLAKDEPCELPLEGYNRWRALEALGVPFGWYLWGEEHYRHPNFTSAVGNPAHEPAHAYPQQVGTFASTTGQARLDPIVIGIIPTAPNRGLWCLISKWYRPIVLRG